MRSASWGSIESSVSCCGREKKWYLNAGSIRKRHIAMRHTINQMFAAALRALTWIKGMFRIAPRGGLPGSFNCVCD